MFHDRVTLGGVIRLMRRVGKGCRKVNEFCTDRFSVLGPIAIEPHSVILTKVRTQGNTRRPMWFWVLTFVRMTAVFESVGSAQPFPRSALDVLWFFDQRRALA